MSERIGRLNVFGLCHWLTLSSQSFRRRCRFGTTCTMEAWNDSGKCLVSSRLSQMEPVEDSQSSHIFICLLFFQFFAVKSAGVWWKSVGRTPFFAALASRPGLCWRAREIDVDGCLIDASISSALFPIEKPYRLLLGGLGKTWKNMEKTCNNCLWVLFCTCQSVTWMVPALGGGYSCDLNLLDLSCGHAERRENPISILRNLCHRRVMGGPSADFPHFAF